MALLRDHKLIVCGLTGSLLAVSYILWRKLQTSVTAFAFNTVPCEIHVINCAAQWHALYPSVKDELRICKVLGIDCEWVSLTNAKRPVSLLQLATPSGVCILIQLLQLDEIPHTLKDVLADKSILKTGVGCLGDARRLMTDHAILVRGCVDLRTLAVRARLNARYDLRTLAVRARLNASGLGLKALTNAVLGADLDKNLLVRAGNWELETLTPEQVKYAAMDALVGVKIFLVLMNKKLGHPLEQQYESIKDDNSWMRVQSMCQGIIDARFQRPDYRSRPPKPESSSGSLQTSSKPDNRATRAYMLRQKPLYHNCQLRAPDGQLLCTCDIKKAEWYIYKGLGKKVEDDPLTIQLTFEPSGRPVNEKNYYLQDKDNKCVVCGRTESYIRKSIVPHEYRKYFPTMMKEHRSHDVVLMCSTCHQQSSLHDAVIKDHLAKECDAPVGTAEDMKFKQDHSLHKVKAAAKALLNAQARIPEVRLAELREVVQMYYGTDVVNDALLQQAMNMDIKQLNNSYIPHGQKVVSHFIENDGLIALERLWRQHFLDSMKPEHLPSLWSVDHSHNELADMNKTLQGTISS